ncbi:MAG: helix-turn-helix domain-containing protein [Actinomycetota bacterium]|nr:helix-turn-helix domain-containing protein [Actinomycetota bacterium]MDQ2756785.1 helix-turn-helix domain-containing protein [Actinomycetota bacterium]
MLTATDRWEISAGLKAGWSLRKIAADLGRAPSELNRPFVADDSFLISQLARARRPGPARGDQRRPRAPLTRRRATWSG